MRDKWPSPPFLFAVALACVVLAMAVLVGWLLA